MGISPIELTDPQSIQNPVLSWKDVTDVPAALVADPFMLCVDGTWHMFFEVLNRETRLGEIGWASSQDGRAWRYRNIVLAEPFHLSYPHVFEWDNAFYMIPEANSTKSIRLYRAAAFPGRWEFVGELCKGGRFADTSIIRHMDKWWLFTECGEAVKLPVLRLYFADELTGPYREHPHSPIVDGDPHIARPGGRVIRHGTSWLRFAQDVVPTYGSRVSAFEITQLTPDTYQERPLQQNPVVAAGASSWNRDGMHHVDAHRLDDGTCLAAVDGFRWVTSSLRWERE